MRGEGKVSAGGARVDSPGSRARGWIHRDRVERRRARGRRSGKIDAPPPRGARARGQLNLRANVGGRGEGRVALARLDRRGSRRSSARRARVTDRDPAWKPGRIRARGRPLLPIERGGIHPRAVRAGTRGLDGFPDEASRLSAATGRGSSLTVVDAEYLQPPGLSRSPRGRVSSPRREDHGGERARVATNIERGSASVATRAVPTGERARRAGSTRRGPSRSPSSSSSSSRPSTRTPFRPCASRRAQCAARARSSSEVDLARLAPASSPARRIPFKNKQTARGEPIGFAEKRAPNDLATIFGSRFLANFWLKDLN